jgi:acyl carrier protein
MTVAEASALMQDVLNFDEVGPDDNFFDLGGTSVLALTIIAEASSRYGVKLRLMDFISNATPVALASLIARESAAADGPVGAVPASLTQAGPAETGRS